MADGVVAAGPSAACDDDVAKRVERRGLDEADAQTFPLLMNWTWIIIVLAVALAWWVLQRVYDIKIKLPGPKSKELEKSTAPKTQRPFMDPIMSGLGK